MKNLLEKIDQLLVNEDRFAFHDLKINYLPKAKKSGPAKKDFLNKVRQANRLGNITDMEMKELKNLAESRISSTAKRTLIGLIKNPKKVNINIDGMKVTSKPMHDGIIFTLPADDFEISMALTDIVDTIGGYKFKANTSKQHMTFEVVPK